MRGTLALACAALVAACSDGGGPAPHSRSVVLVVVDTLRADHTSLAGHARDTTPRLAAFAERALVFEEARSTSSWTKPSVASVFTGLDPRAHGVVEHLDGLHAANRTLAEAFAEAGYATVGVQSNVYLVGPSGMDQGFEAYVDSVEGERATIAFHDGSTGARVNEAALVELDRLLGADRPFFLYVHHYEPHHMYLRGDLVPEDAFGLDAARRAGLDETEMDYLVTGAREGMIEPADVAYLSARYDSEVLYQDRLLGELFDGLAERGVLDEAVVAITADHGEEFLEHGDLSHHNDKLYDELLHVPLLLSVPGRGGERVATPVGLADLGRTLLDAAGLAEVAFPGRSFLDDRAPRPIVAHGTIPAVGGRPRTERDAVVRGRFKLVRDLVGGEVRLFDLASDPEEATDVASAHPDVAAELRALLERHARTEAAERDFPPEAPEVVERRQRWMAEHEDVLGKLGYAGRE